MTLVDANILIDIVSLDAAWSHSSLAALGRQSRLGPLCINAVVYAEISTRYASVREVNTFVRGTNLEIEEMPEEALFLAAKAFERYRKAGGIRTGVLPDFFIGAHALVTGMPLLTRDVRRYRTYFPKVQLIIPDQSN